MTTQVPDGSLEHPFPHDIVIFIGKPFDLEDVKGEEAHGRGIGISFFVIVQGLLPSPLYTAFADEEEGITVPVGLHEPPQVTAVPAFGLQG